jgi:hypothetical protein
MTVNDFVTYVMSNPANTNYSVARAMLEELLGDSPNVDTVLDYVLMTPANTNYSVLKMWLEVLNGETPSPTPDPDPDPEPEPEPEPVAATLSLINVDNPTLTYGIISINYEGVDEAVMAGTNTYDLTVNQEFTVTYNPGDQYTARYGLQIQSGVEQVERLATNKLKFKMTAATGSIIYTNEVGDNTGDDSTK